MRSDDPPSRVFRALANRRRRRLLLAMYEAGPRADEGVDPLELLQSRGTTADVATTRVSLHHADLPKLDDAGLIEWDRESGTVARGPNWGAVAPLLEWLCDHRAELFAEWLSSP